ncbi:hypothetical protein K490DRAFT_65998 [Saccharata proteae CBS 121410]|uniref:Uncharacterized protein n=1 Tax=Saccharata proteae CBS 121410 TaxID=1314787 RepID=A0A9P4HVB3_9PEZI|nr:hypothetical protein K490DRAFT_65998 [Saccharata proteae CBS 121410]
MSQSNTQRNLSEASSINEQIARYSPREPSPMRPRLHRQESFQGLVSVDNILRPHPRLNYEVEPTPSTILRVVSGRVVPIEQTMPRRSFADRMDRLTLNTTDLDSSPQTGEFSWLRLSLSPVSPGSPGSSPPTSQQRPANTQVMATAPIRPSLQRASSMSARSTCELSAVALARPQADHDDSSDSSDSSEEPQLHFAEAIPVRRAAVVTVRSTSNPPAPANENNPGNNSTSTPQPRATRPSRFHERFSLIDCGPPNWLPEPCSAHVSTHHKLHCGHEIRTTLPSPCGRGCERIPMSTRASNLPQFAVFEPFSCPQCAAELAGKKMMASFERFEREFRATLNSQDILAFDGDLSTQLSLETQQRYQQEMEAKKVEWEVQYNQDMTLILGLGRSCETARKAEVIRQLNRQQHVYQMMRQVDSERFVGL